MIEILVYVGAFLLIMLLLGIIVWHITDAVTPLDIALDTEVARKKAAGQKPPPWAEARFRCPNCECKWCRFGAN